MNSITRNQKKSSETATAFFGVGRDDLIPATRDEPYWRVFQDCLFLELSAGESNLLGLFHRRAPHIYKKHMQRRKRPIQLPMFSREGGSS